MLICDDTVLPIWYMRYVRSYSTCTVLLAQTWHQSYLTGKLSMIMFLFFHRNTIHIHIYIYIYMIYTYIYIYVYYICHVIYVYIYYVLYTYIYYNLYYKIISTWTPGISPAIGDFPSGTILRGSNHFLSHTGLVATSKAYFNDVHFFSWLALYIKIGDHLCRP